MSPQKTQKQARSGKKESGNKVDKPTAIHVPKVFVVCDQKDTAPVWGYILRQQGLTVVLETSVEKAIYHWSLEMPDLVVIDVDISKNDHMKLYSRFREVSLAPILLFLPTHHETQILEAYAAGVDDVVVKPISPAIFLAKILAWGRRSGTVREDNIVLLTSGKYTLEPARRYLIRPNDSEVNLTNLEFRLLHLLMSQPGHIFPVDDIIDSIWGGYGNGDQVLLKNVVYRLRKKIELDPGHPALIRTWQRGYSFEG